MQAGSGLRRLRNWSRRSPRPAAWAASAPSSNRPRASRGRWPACERSPVGPSRSTPWCPCSTRRPSGPPSRQSQRSSLSPSGTRESSSSGRGAGAKVVHQVHTVGQARRAVELGVDVIIAQGSEAGGQGLALGVGAMALVPQVAEAVDPIPVLAAGGVADGRGLAAALVLGAQGANVGTRFLASEEATADEGWKRTILGAESEDAVRFEAWGTSSRSRAGRLCNATARSAYALRRGVVGTLPSGQEGSGAAAG